MKPALSLPEWAPLERSRRADEKGTTLVMATF